MIVDVKLARWKHCAIVSMSEDLGHCLEKGLWKDGVSLCNIDGTLVICPGGDLKINYKDDHSYGAETPLAIVANLYHGSEKTKTYRDLLDLPLCSSTDIRAELDEDGMMTVPIPDTTDLKWPTNRFALSPEEWIEVIEVRMMAALKAGFTRIEAPSFVKKKRGLWSEAWKRIGVVT